MIAKLCLHKVLTKQGDGLMFNAKDLPNAKMSFTTTFPAHDPIRILDTSLSGKDGSL